MKGGKTTLNSIGYTIIEVMIVLAVSGVMFVIAANFVNGKQAKTAFTQGANELATQMQDIITDVEDGKYSDVTLSCTGSTSVNIQSTPAAQGSNAPCVFKGKLMHFYGTPTRDKYEVIPLVDLRSSRDDDLSHVNSKLLLVQKEVVPQHLDVQKTTVKYGATTVNDGYNIGFVQSSGKSVDSAHPELGYESGSQTVSLVYAPAGGNMSTTGPAVYDSLPGLLPATSFELCVSDGSRSALISVGSAKSGKLTVTTTMKGVAAC